MQKFIMGQIFFDQQGSILLDFQIQLAFIGDNQTDLDDWVVRFFDIIR